MQGEHEMPSNRQARLLAIAQQRQSELCAAIPRWQELDRQQAQALERLGRAAMTGGDIARHGQMLAEIDQQRVALLREHGYPADYLQPAYACERCRDTGFVQDENGAKHACRCTQRRLQTRVWSQLPDFDSFDQMRLPPAQRQRACRLRDRLMEYVRCFPDDKQRNIILRGASGLGKTFYLSCVARGVQERGYHVIFLTSYQLLERFRAQHIEGERCLPELIAADLLVIDDLGTEPVYRNITKEYLFILVNERMMAGRSLAIATNLSPEHMKERYGERLTSRLHDQSVAQAYALTGEDIRLYRG